ncbi:MAG: 50S ribosomal protein L18 [Chloroflexi bacterium]|nr:50S ribosomal protein L18 [Chloroflexota bacterium]|tara:strand:- start:1390 stop:1767 length:378 start_codon:yes stop_codon:yes gene_type:complete
MVINNIRTKRRLMRHARVRKKVSGLSNKPRLSIFRAIKHVYVQVIDDSKGETLVSASSLDPEIVSKISSNGKNTKTHTAKLVGELLAQRAKKKKIKSVVFDRGGYKFHGRVKALAEAAREGGIKF